VGTLGAAIGTIPGILLAMGLYYAGFIAGIAGLLIISGAMFMYERFAGKLTKTGIIICIILTLLAIIVVQPMFSYSLDIYYNTPYYHGYSYLVALFDVPFVIFSDTKMLGYYVLDVLIGLGLASLASYSKIKGKILEKTSSPIFHRI
jgi:hypothetical protein